MNFEKLVKFVKVLQQKSKEGKITWEVGVGQDSFEVHFAENTVRIREVYDSWGKETSYQLVFLDPSGEVQDVIDTDRMKEFTGHLTYQDLEEIYSSARRKARSLDKSIDSMLSELEKD